MAAKSILLQNPTNQGCIFNKDHRNKGKGKIGKIPKKEIPARLTVECG